MPSANRRSARSRAGCGRSPWIAAASTPRSWSARATRSHSRLVGAEHGELRDSLADRADHPVLVHVVDGEEQVVHRADRVRGGVDGDLDGVAEVAPHQVPDVAVQGGREQHGLCPPGAVAKDPFDLRREAVVGHPVGLVEHDDVDVGQRQLLRLEQVDQPQRGGHDDLDALAQHVDLVVAAGAAVDGEDPLAHVGGERLEHLGDLHRQLTGRHEDQAEGRSGRRRVVDPGQHRHAEGQRLAGSGLGATTDVVAVHRHGDGGRLDLEGLGEPGGGQRLVDVRGNAQFGEPGGGFDSGQDGDGGQRGGAVTRRFGGGAARPPPAAGRTTPGEASVMVTSTLPGTIVRSR